MPPDHLNPGGLTPFQIAVAELFFALSESDGFLLAGGAALAAQHLTTRPTQDLDLFTRTGRGTVPAARDAFERACRQRGWSVQRIRNSDTFCRLIVVGDEELLVDLALDSPPSLPPSTSAFFDTIEFTDRLPTWVATRPGSSRQRMAAPHHPRYNGRTPQGGSAAMRKVVHFEIPADDVARAKQFYGGVFGWQLQDMPEMSYTIVRTTDVDEQTQMPTSPGAINGGMMQRTEETPTPVLTIDVDAIDDTLKQVESAGGRVVRPRTEIPGMGAFAYFKDPEGNTLGLWENA